MRSLFRGGGQEARQSRQLRGSSRENQEALSAELRRRVLAAEEDLEQALQCDLQGDSELRDAVRSQVRRELCRHQAGGTHGKVSGDLGGDHAQRQHEYQLRAHARLQIQIQARYADRRQEVQGIQFRSGVPVGRLHPGAHPGESGPRKAARHTGVALFAGDHAEDHPRHGDRVSTRFPDTQRPADGDVRRVPTQHRTHHAIRHVRRGRHPRLLPSAGERATAARRRDRDEHADTGVRGHDRVPRRHPVCGFHLPGIRQFGDQHGRCIREEATPDPRCLVNHKRLPESQEAAVPRRRRPEHRLTTFLNF